MSATASQGLLYDRPMRVMQFVIVIVCCLTNIADGADIASLAFATPVLIKDWGLRPGVMGLVFGATATGLATGAFLLSPLADKIGRRRVMLAAIAAVAITMLLAARANTVHQLVGLRLVTGMGLGALVVCLNVTVSEFTNARWRNLLVAVLHCGFSIGTMIGGAFAAVLLEPYGWRTMFVATGALNVATFILVLLLVPESPSFLITRGGAKTLALVNRTLERIGQPPIEALPAAVAARGRATVAAILGAGRRNATLLIWLAQFAYAVVSYLLLNWKPTVLVNAGLTPSQAGLAGLASGIAGILGHIAVGLLSRGGREARWTTIFFLLLTSSLLLFGLQPPTVWGLVLSAGFTSFCNVGAFTGLFLIALSFYPPAVRTTGIGLLVGIARLGAITGPLFGGLLLDLGYDRKAMFVLLAAISLIPIVAMHFAAKRMEAGAEAT